MVFVFKLCQGNETWAYMCLTLLWKCDTIMTYHLGIDHNWSYLASHFFFAPHSLTTETDTDPTLCLLLALTNAPHQHPSRTNIKPAPTRPATFTPHTCCVLAAHMFMERGCFLSHLDNKSYRAPLMAVYEYYTRGGEEKSAHRTLFDRASIMWND